MTKRRTCRIRIAACGHHDTMRPIVGMNDTIRTTMCGVLRYLQFSMQTISNDNFGPLIAYIVPGVTALWGLSLYSPSLAAWFANTPENAPTISGFLYLTLASLTAGLTITAIRWAIVDQLHAFTGLRPPKLDFSRLALTVDAYKLLIEIHYRHYLFYSNMFVATGIAYVCHRIRIESLWHLDVIDPGFVLIQAIFFMTSRDTLWKYYQRTQQLLRGPTSQP